MRHIIALFFIQLLFHLEAATAPISVGLCIFSITASSKIWQSRSRNAL